MSTFKNISEHSILSEKPWIYSKYGDNSENLLVNNNSEDSKICRLYVENWYDDIKDRIPNGFIRNPDVLALLTPPKTSIVSINNPYIRFMIQGVSPSFQETISPMKNLTQGFTTYSFGQEPPVVGFSGILLNTEMDNWSETFLAIYSNFLRASKLASLSIINGRINSPYQVVIMYQNKIMKGSLISMAKTTNATVEQGVAFSFQLLLKDLDFKWKKPEDVKEIETFKDTRSIRELITSKISTTQNVARTDINTTKGNVALDDNASVGA